MFGGLCELLVEGSGDSFGVRYGFGVEGEGSVGGRRRFLASERVDGGP